MAEHLLVQSQNKFLNVIVVWGAAVGKHRQQTFSIRPHGRDNNNWIS